MGLHRGKVYSMLEQAKEQERKVYIFFADGTVKRFRIVDVTPPIAYGIRDDIADSTTQSIPITKVTAVEWA
ncbi:hypothetical protein HM1_2994 [Heliomicrobium modesticaldum Ice1]|uniref:Uncharacterized protein n=1 Tax=Heliobacterium modesticaldum (strain ATCC 51547 / Ice1) TaxID=498761 RepID=B0TDH8_HELMI|nr:hypothetical protein [Heliomicrobium modesticaldum]ABZ85503.1 hypothetical protein HM1_2994 [Heliomicrobium modesticaldum Ice1]